MTRSSQRANRAAQERDRSTAANAGTHVRVFGGERHRVSPPPAAACPARTALNPNRFAGRFTEHTSTDRFAASGTTPESRDTTAD